MLLSAAEAVELANAGALCVTKTIAVRSVTGEDFDKIIGYELGEKPDYREPGWDEDEAAGEETEPEYAYAEDNDIPF